ncbi:MAG TPA: hypothetical protein VK841_26165 [Polyangiaceae bacterium]|jgi:hypothetical protein|nr:hypothetical protein [Polyangiaceae bacterium]
MVVQKTVRIALCTAVVVMAPACASQSGAFLHMSATEHEAAAHSVSDPALAQQHEEAAQRMHSQEAALCYGISEADRDRGPLANTGEVTSVEIVRDRGLFPKGPLVPVGVAVDLRAESGMTEQWLGRVVACHMAHVAVVGRDRFPGPLEVPDAQASVSSTGVGFRVTITSRDSDVAKSVVTRGKELALASSVPVAAY